MRSVTVYWTHGVIWWLGKTALYRWNILISGFECIFDVNAIGEITLDTKDVSFVVDWCLVGLVEAQQNIVDGVCESFSSLVLKCKSNHPSCPHFKLQKYSRSLRIVHHICASITIRYTTYLSMELATRHALQPSSRITAFSLQSTGLLMS